MSQPKVLIPEIHQDVTNYTNALRAVGIDPFVVTIPSAQEKCPVQKQFLDWQSVRACDYDGLLLPGGCDICPDMYFEENHGCGKIIKEMDALQAGILKEFVRLRKPVLGVCRGLQIINVFFGGSLIQDLPDAPVHSGGRERRDTVHDCEAISGCWLSKLYGEHFTHNSNHHQAINRLGEGLVVDSRYPADQVIEAIHHESLPIYAVQWHPERMCLAHSRSDTVSGLEIFRFFHALCESHQDSV